MATGGSMPSGGRVVTSSASHLRRRSGIGSDRSPASRRSPGRSPGRPPIGASFSKADAVTSASRKSYQRRRAARLQHAYSSSEDNDGVVTASVLAAVRRSASTRAPVDRAARGARRARSWRISGLRAPTRLYPASVIPRVSRQSTSEAYGRAQPWQSARSAPAIGTIEVWRQRDRELGVVGMSKADVSCRANASHADHEMLRRVLYARIARLMSGMVVE